jgi:hypothetical protein
VLGPEVQGDLCDHCANYLEAIRVQEDDISEVVRVAARGGRTVGDVREVALRTLVSIGYLRFEEIEPIRANLSGLALAVGATAAVSEHASAVFVSLALEFLGSLVASREKVVGRG